MKKNKQWLKNFKVWLKENKEILDIIFFLVNLVVPLLFK